jgi:ribokinase
MAPRIGVVGSTMTDLITYGARMPRAGETLEAERFAVGRGGKGANQAVAAARLGAGVSFIGRVGEDQFGRDTCAALSAEGIDISHLLTTPGVASGVAPIFVADNGENCILIIKGANARVTPADIEAASPVLRGCDLILLQLEIPLEAVYATIDWAGRHGKRVLLNPAPATDKLAFERIASVDYFVPNQTELAILSGLPTETVAEATAAARHLLARGMRRIIVTLGGDGVLLVTPEEAAHIPALTVKPRDTTGAGDAFIGAFAFYETAGEPLDTALRKAAAYAALSVTRDGTQTSFAKAEEFERFLAERGAESPPA